jgi:Glyoxalase-like domain
VKGNIGMSSSLVAIAIDCAEAPAVARFWADVLGRQVAEDSTSERVILLLGDGGTGGPRITFNKVPEPKTVKNRVHFDLVSDTFDAETERVLSLGRPKAPRPAARQVSLDDLRRYRKQRVRPDRRVDPPRP